MMKCLLPSVREIAKRVRMKRLFVYFLPSFKVWDDEDFLLESYLTSWKISPTMSWVGDELVLWQVINTIGGLLKVFVECFWPFHCFASFTCWWSWCLESLSNTLFICHTGVADYSNAVSAGVALWRHIINVINSTWHPAVGVYHEDNLRRRF